MQIEPSTLRYTTCDPALPNNPETCADDVLVLPDQLETSVGDVVEFVTRQSVHLGISTVRGYALKAYLNKSKTPHITNVRL